MKDKLKRFVIKHAILERLMFAYYHAKHAATVNVESEKRKSISIFDYARLSQEMPFGPEERVIDNNLYGHAHQLKKYAGIKTDLKSYLEHGLFWGGMVHPDERFWHFKKIITFSNLRKIAIENALPGKTAIPVGPYIHYAEPVFSADKMAALKAELGKVLLVFPSHSVKNLESQFDFEHFLGEINRLKSGFDTVLVSLYFIDAQDEKRVKMYTDKGFRIVTSGHKFDHNFIARQKTIIQLADATVSNEVGTHVGYCIHLNKPHYIFKQKLARTSTSSEEIERHKRLFNNQEVVLREEQFEEVYAAFSSYSNTEITDLQRSVVEKYWGTDCVKSPEEMKNLFGN